LRPRVLLRSASFLVLPRAHGRICLASCLLLGLPRGSLGLVAELLSLRLGAHVGLASLILGLEPRAILCPSSFLVGSLASPFSLYAFGVSSTGITPRILASGVVLDVTDFVLHLRRAYSIVGAAASKLHLLLHHLSGVQL
jgi:hypothetical protein